MRFGFGQESERSKTKPTLENQISQEDVAKIKNEISKTKVNVPKDTMTDWETEDIKQRWEKGAYTIQMASIEPRGGPLEGQTRVTVRAEGIGQLVDAYPAPKCKFGKNSMIVEAIYVKCTKKPADFYAKEKGQGAEQWNSTCIQCESSPASSSPDIVPLTISFTGLFDDATSSLPFRYYE